uniref:GATA transcription factor 9 n=1 Tax=Anthurium amnicola TaxID=1678845 RepID=A0A1D1Y8V9_9ARAE
MPRPMAPELDMGMVPMGMTGMEAPSFSTAYARGLPAGDAMRIDDLLDFSNQDDLFDGGATSTTSSVVENNQQQHFQDPLHESSAAFGNLDISEGCNLISTFSDHLYVPSEEVAELEWLSKFVDDSFSDGVPFPSSLGACGEAGAPSSKYSAGLRADPSTIPARARSKRSRVPATAIHQAGLSTWSSASSSSSSLQEFLPGCSSSSSKAGGVRRCTHCWSERTPQWRTGPLGAKTLCNACGVRYKSGRLVPEYRPAASPSFVLTQHSNSHRKVLELRRQKEVLLRQHPPAPSSMPPSPPPELLFRDYEVC